MTSGHMVETVSMQMLKTLIIINAATLNILIVNLSPKVQLCMLPLYAETHHFQMLSGGGKKVLIEVKSLSTATVFCVCMGMFC